MTHHESMLEIQRLAEDMECRMSHERAARVYRAIDELRIIRIAAFREAAEIAKNFFGGPTRKWASENADIYHAQDDAVRRVAKVLRAHADELEKEGK